MKRFVLLSTLCLLLGVTATAQTMNWNKIDPMLDQQIRERPGDYFRVTVMLSDFVDVTAMLQGFEQEGLDIHQRRRTVVTALKDKAQATQGPLRTFLESHPGVRPHTIEAHWISNDIEAEMTESAIAAISQRSDVHMLYFDPPTKVDDAGAAAEAPFMPRPESVGGREAGLDAINAPALWALGYTGVGTKVLIIDSGVSLDHPATQRNYYGNEVGDALAWYNPGGQKAPFDCDEHGTHVNGVATGLELATRDTFGVAFNAMWMGSPAVDGGTVGGSCPFDVDDLDALQWALDPDNNPNTTDDMPDVINGSYGTDPEFFSPGICTGSVFKLRMDALEAASIVFVQSAGNYGPGDSTMGVYKNISTSLVNAFTVGSVNGYNANLPISSFSSRGPSRCGGTGGFRFKPEVVAPGANVRSSVPGGGYKLLPGTSFSAPHVSGAALLLKEAFPTATSIQLKEALYFTAVDKGNPGEDNAYGNGVIDVLAAYNYLIQEGLTPTTVSRDKDAILNALMVDAVSCGSGIAPEVMIENNGKTTMTSAEITYTYSDGSTGTFNWTGSLAPGGTELVKLPQTNFPVGRYDLEVEITQVDGQADYYALDNRASASFSLIADDLPTVENVLTNPAPVCANSSTLLKATVADDNKVAAWYDDPNASTLLYVGNNFITPPISGQKFYYVGVVGQEYLGVPNSQAGSSFPSSNIDSYLEFEVYAPITLRSILIQANSPGQRIIQIVRPNGTLVGSVTTPNISVGEHRVDLNFPLQAGTYRMRLGGANTNLFATVSNVNFPYDIPGVMSITGSDNGFYSYFYDWEVEYRSGCELVQAAVIQTPGTVTADFTADKTTVNLSVQEPVTFTNASTGASTYEWDFGDGNSSTDESPSHVYAAPGQYEVTMKARATAGCIAGDTMTINVEWLTSLEDLASEFGEMTVFPNPSQGRYTLELNLKQSYPIALQVTDLTGKQVQQLAADSYQQATLPIDLRSLPDGVYLLQVNVDGQVLTEKLIKAE